MPRGRLANSTLASLAVMVQYQAEDAVKARNVLALLTRGNDHYNGRGSNVSLPWGFCDRLAARWLERRYGGFAIVVKERAP